MKQIQLTYENLNQKMMRIIKEERGTNNIFYHIKNYEDNTLILASKNKVSELYDHEKITFNNEELYVMNIDFSKEYLLTRDKLQLLNIKGTDIKRVTESINKEYINAKLLTDTNEYDLILVEAPLKQIVSNRRALKFESTLVFDGIYVITIDNEYYWFSDFDLWKLLKKTECI